MMGENGATSGGEGSVIELDAVSVHYGSFRALSDVTLRVPPGPTGLVGRNGAGKSTLLKLLLGLTPPSAGSGIVLDVPLPDPEAPRQDVAGRSWRRISEWFSRTYKDLEARESLLRRAVGYMPEGDSLIPGLRGVEQVILAGELCGLPSREATRRAHEALLYVGLGEARYRPVEQYSAGMRQRLKLAVALAHDPQMLLLDEPTVGLDPPGRERMLALIRDLTRRHGKSLLICTHLLADIETTCQHVVMIDRGRILTSGPLEKVLERPSNCYHLGYEGSGASFADRLSREGATVDADPQDLAGTTTSGAVREMRVTVPADFDTRRFFHLAGESNVRIRLLEIQHENLSDLYQRLLGRETLHEH